MTAREGGTPIVLRDMALIHDLPSSTLDLYVWLRDTYGHAGTFSVSQREIRAETGKGPNTINRGLRELETAGALEIVERGTGRVPNVYRLPVFPETPLPWRSVVRVRPADRRYLLAVYGPNATGFRRLGIRRLGRTTGRSMSSAHRALHRLRRARLIHRVAPGTWNPAEREGDEAAYAFRVIARGAESNTSSAVAPLAHSLTPPPPVWALSTAGKPYVPRGLDPITKLPRRAWPVWRQRRDYFPIPRRDLFTPEPVRRTHTVPTDVAGSGTVDRMTDPTPEIQPAYLDPARPLTDAEQRRADEFMADFYRRNPQYARKA